MLPSLILLAGLSALFVLTVAPSWQARKKLRARIRADWGHPRERPRNLGAIAKYHHALVAASGSSLSLDDGTWDDLNLDAV